MSVVSELIRTEADGTISFGNYELPAKSKKSDFEHDGDLYKVKTFKEITKPVSYTHLTLPTTERV